MRPAEVWISVEGGRNIYAGSRQEHICWLLDGGCNMCWLLGSTMTARPLGAWLGPTRRRGAAAPRSRPAEQDAGARKACRSTAGEAGDAAAAAGATCATP